MNLNLNKKEQDVMAEICSILSSFLMKDICDKDIENLGEKIFLAVDFADVDSQFFGKLYDKFHRTGSNF